MSLPAVAIALAGIHLNFTTIHSDGFINMYEDGNFLADSSQWTGLLVDQIDWIAKQAGFTYTLFPPSGLGDSCSNSTGLDENWAGEYNCGSEDVWDGRTDAYWAPCENEGVTREMPRVTLCMLSSC